jgi:hypothetical protein
MDGLESGATLIGGLRKLGATSLVVQANQEHQCQCSYASHESPSVAQLKSPEKPGLGRGDGALAQKMALLQSVLYSDISDKGVSVFSDRRSDRAI